jgi:uncharacterized protein
MTKPRGAVCNLDCAYCYYLAKERLYPDSDHRMADTLLAEYTRQFIEAQTAREITFTWQGGEPTLMGLDFFRQAIRYQQQYRKPGTHIQNSLQTNGVLLDDEWCAFFKAHDFLIGISLDGPRALHDHYRVDKGGQPTFDRVLCGVRLLQQHGVEFNVLTTVHAANEHHGLEVYRFLRDEVGIRYIQFIPIVEHLESQEANHVTARSVSGAGYGRFLIDVFEEWVRHDVGQVYVQMFDVALAAWVGDAPGLCVFEETCGAALAMEHTGDVYSCDHFVEPQHLVGNIVDVPLSAIVVSDQQRAFGAAKRDSLPRYCRDCSVRFVCHGGCPKDRFNVTPDGEAGLNYLCAGYQAFFEHIRPAMEYMAAELTRQRPPASIMVTMARRDAELRERLAHTGRNDPCPCGSGLKFKKCHGRRVM